MEGYSIAPDTIYMKKKYLFSGINEKRHGKIRTDIVAIPKNFDKDFKFYLLVVNQKVMETLNIKHLEMEVCTKDSLNSTSTSLEFDYTPEDVLVNKYYEGNPHQNIIIGEDMNVTTNGEFFTVF
jgi:hypothetical protein